ncbi:MAG: transposase [Bacteroidota bacterium]
MSGFIRPSHDTNNLLGDKSKQALSIDESSTGKAGSHSVGVSHQYNGNKGKLDNCQTGVYAALSRGNRVGIINARLFLPDEWVNDVDRCAKAGIPKEAIVKKTKIELGIASYSYRRKTTKHYK